MILVKEKNKGFSLVELLIVLAILAILIVISVGVLNPIALVNKARDSKRKNDLNSIKRAFEEYYNDNGRYPYTEMGFCYSAANCGKSVSAMEKYLRVCLCDPKNVPYTFEIDPKWFKVMTNLENKTDSDIPPEWYTNLSKYNFNLDVNKINYGVSSPNISWYERTLGSGCDITRCYRTTSCNDPLNGCNEAKDGIKCFVYNNNGTDSSPCNDSICEVSCCGSGCSR